MCHAFSLGEENLPLNDSETLEPVKCCRTGIIGMEFLKMGRIKNATFYGIYEEENYVHHTAH